MTSVRTGSNFSSNQSSFEPVNSFTARMSFTSSESGFTARSEYTKVNSFDADTGCDNIEMSSSARSTTGDITVDSCTIISEDSCTIINEDSCTILNEDSRTIINDVLEISRSATKDFQESEHKNEIPIETRDPTNRDQGTCDQGNRDKGTRGQGTSDKGNRYKGTKNQVKKSRGTRDHRISVQETMNQEASAQRSSDQGTMDQGTMDQGARDQGTRDQGTMTGRVSKKLKKSKSKTFQGSRKQSSERTPQYLSPCTSLVRMHGEENLISLEDENLINLEAEAETEFIVSSVEAKGQEQLTNAEDEKEKKIGEFFRFHCDKILIFSSFIQNII